jgi:hypothetical protein
MFSAMRTPLGCVLGLALAGLVLGACGDDDQPGTLPDVTPSTTSVESPRATPSGDPTAQLEAEIMLFMDDYDRTVDESWTSSDALRRRREMFADSCIPCLRGYELTQRAHDEGLVLEAEFGTIRSVRLDAIDGDVVTFLVVDDVPAGRLVDRSGQVVQEFGATIGAQIVYRAQHISSGGWVIIASEVLSVESGGAPT